MSGIDPADLPIGTRLVHENHIHVIEEREDFDDGNEPGWVVAGKRENGQPQRGYISDSEVANEWIVLDE